jgi:hypothetical protein
MKKLCTGIVLTSALLFARTAAAQNPCTVVCQPEYPCGYSCDLCVGDPGLWENLGEGQYSCWGEMISGTCGDIGQCGSDLCVNNCQPTTPCGTGCYQDGWTTCGEQGYTCGQQQQYLCQACEPYVSCNTPCDQDGRATTCGQTGHECAESCSHCTQESQCDKECWAGSSPGTCGGAGPDCGCWTSDTKWIGVTEENRRLEWDGGQWVTYVDCVAHNAYVYNDTCRWHAARLDHCTYTQFLGTDLEGYCCQDYGAQYGGCGLQYRCY